MSSHLKTDPSRKGRNGLAIGAAFVGILLIAANMRASITSVGPIMSQIRSAYQLSSEASGL